MIHLFAQQTQYEANCRNVFFEGKRCYSYGRHYLLGEFIENPQGEKAIMINDRGYSSTTANHIREMQGATRQYKQFFTESSNGGRVYDRLQYLLHKLQAARKKELYLQPALSLYASYHEWLAWSGNSTIASIEEIIKVFQGKDYLEYLNEKNARIRKDQQKAARLAKKLCKQHIAEFLAYKIDRLYDSPEDYLRVSQDGQFVETSQRVRVSIKEAQTLYRLIVAGKDIKGFVIGGYTVISINGTLKIGCHHINMDSVHTVGKLIL